MYFHAKGVLTPCWYDDIVSIGLNYHIDGIATVEAFRPSTTVEQMSGLIM